MSNLNLFPSRWPETENYLERIGQINNDLMVLREITANEALEPDWLEELGIGIEDLTKQPSAVMAMRLMYDRAGMLVKSANQVQDWQELEAEHNERRGNDDPHQETLLEDPTMNQLPEATEKQLLALPELELKLRYWLTKVLIRHEIREPENLTMHQIFMIVNLLQFLTQEGEWGAAWEGEFLLSLLSSEFFAKAGPQLQQNE